MIGFFLALNLDLNSICNKSCEYGVWEEVPYFDHHKTDCLKVGLKCKPVHGRLESGSTERDASEMVVSSYAKGDKQHRGGDHRAERGERERGEQRGE